MTVWQWTNTHNDITLKLRQFNGVFPSLILFTPLHCLLNLWLFNSTAHHACSTKSFFLLKYYGLHGWRPKLLLVMNVGVQFSEMMKKWLKWVINRRDKRESQDHLISVYFSIMTNRADICHWPYHKNQNEK